MSSGFHTHVHEQTQTHKKNHYNTCTPWPQYFIPLKPTQVRIYCKQSKQEETQKSLADSPQTLFIDHRVSWILHHPKMLPHRGQGGVHVYVLRRTGATQTRVCVSHIVLCISIQHSLQVFSMLLKILVTVVSMVMPSLSSLDCMYGVLVHLFSV